jgi:hypothetical protein
MLGKDFRNLAEAVTCTYGNNPWFFLRELAQNSRDAGAQSIRVKAERTAAGLETLTFADNGRGMSSVHARRFLFRLYASDKAEDKMSAGKYGIGFWTILGFGPSQVSLQSRTKKTGWAVVMNADLEMESAACSLTRPGTTIALTRPAVFSTAHEFNSTVENELRGYCQYLRRKDRRGTMLPVFFHGQNVTIPMSLPGPLSYSFHCGSVEGAVGLAEKPLVRLYARGLPVWQGAFLDQMSHLQTRSAGQSEIGRGLAPVFLLNGNQLDVTFSRRLVLENMALKKVRKTAEKALRLLLTNSLESAFPRKWHQRRRAQLQSFFRRLGRPGWKLLPLVLLVILPLEMIILNRFFSSRTTRVPVFFNLRTDSVRYPGAAVSMSFSESTVRFTYSPPVPCWFKIFVAAEYDLQAGFIRSPERFSSPPLPFQSCDAETAVSMRLSTSEGGRIFLPLPPGHALDQAGVVFETGKHLQVYSNSQGESSAEIPASAGTIVYQSCQAKNRELTVTETSLLTLLPDGLAVPAALERSLTDGRFLTAAEKVFRANALVRNLIIYDTSWPTAQSYQQRSPGQPWLAGVLAIGKGDCDVINGINALFLRKMGIPARLVIGLIGTQGRIQSGLHAWCEYFDQGWKISDASMGTAETTMPTPETERSLLAGSDFPAETSRFPGPGIANLKNLALPALTIMALTLALIVFFKRRHDRQQYAMAPALNKATKEFLLPIIQQALLQPEVWGRESPLWNYRFLPTVNGKPMAINRALALLRRGRLLLFTSQNQLVTAMKRSGIPILDLSQNIFAPLLNLFSGAVNLDLLYQLQPEPPSRPGRTTGSLLDAVNAFLRKNIKKSIACLLSPGLGEADFLNISLPVPPSQNRIFFPQRFIAINPQGSDYNSLSALYKKNQPLAIFRFLKILNSESLLPVADPDALLKKAARCLLRKYRGIKK